MNKVDRDIPLYSKNELKILSKYVCWLCDNPLPNSFCGAVFDIKCDEAARIKKRKECLKAKKDSV